MIPKSCYHSQRLSVLNDSNTYFAIRILVNKFITSIKNLKVKQLKASKILLIFQLFLSTYLKGYSKLISYH